MNFEQVPDPSDSGLADRSIAAQQVTHGIRREQLHLRNHDIVEGYDIDIRLQSEEGSSFNRQIYLQPGAVRCLGDLVPAGNWQVSVSLDGKSDETAWCALGPTIGHTAVIECGNGVVTVGQRL
jgi:hypothetical protein